MTGDVDLDRLADYVGGALEGTSDEAAVAELVATDPRWTRAHAALVAADAFVRSDLALLAAEPEPMPDEVTARLTAAIAAEPPLSAPAPDGAPRTLTVLPGGRAAPRRAPARRWPAFVGAAAAVAVVGLGAVSLTSGLGDDRGSAGNHGTTSARSLASGSPERAAPPPSSAGMSSAYTAAEVRTSGFDYSADTMATLGGASVAAGSDSIRTEGHPDQPSPAAGATEVPAPLRRLTEPDARAACLKAIVTQYGGTATLLDYARYQGSPALVVVLDGAGGAAGHKRVVAVGPTCGTGGVIADQRYSAPVG
jgi:anti-sigma factor RsiW